MSRSDPSGSGQAGRPSVARCVEAARPYRAYFPPGAPDRDRDISSSRLRALRLVCSTSIEAHDKHTRGIVVLGLDAPDTELAASFRVAAAHDLVRGFAVGRTIFGDVARAWMKGGTTDAAAVSEMASLSHERIGPPGSVRSRGHSTAKRSLSIHDTTFCNQPLSTVLVQDAA